VSPHHDDAAPVPATLETLHEHGVVSPLDRHFALAMGRIAGERDPSVLLAAALASHKVQQGHVCLDLPRLCRDETALDGERGTLAVLWPEVAAWLVALRASPLFGTLEDPAPLHLDGAGRVYLRRYFEHERGLAAAIRERAGRTAPELDRAALQAGLDRLFGAPRHGTARRQLDLFERTATAGEPDGQRLAAQRAVERGFCVISGGPGTGKTSTVVKILALLAEQTPPGRPAPRMLLLAPTGKAAARLSESVKRSKHELPCAPEVLAAIPEEASTIHRALGAFGGHALRFRHDENAPLPADVIVVDEASMVDLALMARLFTAAPRDARVILLGDRDQLASVEAGAVLGDICGAGLERDATKGTAVAGSIALLTRSYRYAEESGIRRLADAINAGQSARALEILRDPTFSDVALVEPAPGGLLGVVARKAVTGFEPLLTSATPLDRLRALDRFALLCAHRHGPSGQLAINAGVEAALRDAGMVSGAPGGRYAGRPVIVTQNDYQARLFNGEVGVLSRDPRDHTRTLSYFMAADGRVREVAAARLPPHESAYALSVHKSQGSEFDEVAVVLPAEPSPVLSRELLYTAITRARRKVVLYASAAIATLAIDRSVHRSSGLRDALWSASG
jgi:exodeoxyribonuclease V alpha subunit